MFSLIKSLAKFTPGALKVGKSMEALTKQGLESDKAVCFFVAGNESRTCSAELDDMSSVIVADGTLWGRSSTLAAAESVFSLFGLSLFVSISRDSSKGSSGTVTRFVKDMASDVLLASRLLPCCADAALVESPMLSSADASTLICSVSAIDTRDRFATDSLCVQNPGRGHFGSLSAETLPSKSMQSRFRAFWKA